MSTGAGWIAACSGDSSRPCSATLHDSATEQRAGEQRDHEAAPPAAPQRHEEQRDGEQQRPGRRPGPAPRPTKMPATNAASAAARAEPLTPRPDP